MDKTTANTKMLAVYSNCLKHKLASYSYLILSLGMQIYTSHDIRMKSLKFIVYLHAY